MILLYISDEIIIFLYHSDELKNNYSDLMKEISSTCSPTNILA